MARGYHLSVHREKMTGNSPEPDSGRASENVNGNSPAHDEFNADLSDRSFVFSIVYTRFVHNNSTFFLFTYSGTWLKLKMVKSLKISDQMVMNFFQLHSVMMMMMIMWNLGTALTTGKNSRYKQAMTITT